jgi:RNA methyltransferase, TrmH family
MLSKNKIKLINSLKIKKYREQLGMFVAEGNKLVHEVMNSSLAVAHIYATNEWLKKNPIIQNGIEIIEVSNQELERISDLKTPQEVMAIVEMRHPASPVTEISRELSLVLDEIQNPGNFGTILRTADWFGIQNIYCSENTTDLYNNKVIQASMGAICRVNVYYAALEKLLGDAKEMNIPILGTFLEGENIYTAKLPASGLIVLGNEGNGISKSLWPYINHKIKIPEIQREGSMPESLNVAVAAGIVCSEFMRRRFY